MRIAVLGLGHETNTFSNVPATYERFVEDTLLRGEEIARRYQHSRGSIAGFYRARDRLGFELVPLLYAWTGPIGMITADAFDRIVGEMLDLLRTRGPWNGVLLPNHGAAVSAQYHDVDGEIAARVRALVGPDVPIGMALDLHGNITQRMIENCTAAVFYRSNPHLDALERGEECAEIVARTIRGEIRPVQALETPPLVINIVKQFTGEEPMKSVMADAEAVIAQPGILSASVIEGYPYADVPEMGMSFLAIADGDPAKARAAARWMARRAWARREEFVGDVPGPIEALQTAAASPGPVVLMDVGDNIGGGSPADSTILLAEARRLGIGSYLQTLYDPEAVRACEAAGVGATLALAVGGKTDDRHGRPVELTGYVRLIADGKFEDRGPTHGGTRYFDGGHTVVLETPEGQTLVLTSRRVMNTSIQQMYALGIRPEEKQVVVAKGVVSPRPAYEPIAKQIILVNTPGVTTADLSFFAYKHHRRPLFPFERDATYE